MRRGGLEAGARVLEVGCGTGKLTELLAARGLEVDAVDPGEAMIAAARRRVGDAPNVRFHHGRFEDVALAEDAYDAVFSATAFHWVEPEVGWVEGGRASPRPRAARAARLRGRVARRLGGRRSRVPRGPGGVRAGAGRRLAADARPRRAPPRRAGGARERLRRLGLDHVRGHPRPHGRRGGGALRARRGRPRADVARLDGGRADRALPHHLAARSDPRGAPSGGRGGRPRQSSRATAGASAGGAPTRS